jgi:hypothetical protein
MGKIFNRIVKEQRDKVTFNIFFYFLITFITVRVLVYVFPALHLFIRGIHVHHLNYGIVLLVIVGYWSLVNQNNKNILKIAKIYGIGIGLTFDEFGMWFLLEDNYSVRLSYDAIIIILILFINIIYFNNFWKKIILKNLVFLKKPPKN